MIECLYPRFNNEAVSLLLIVTFHGVRVLKGGGSKEHERDTAAHATLKVKEMPPHWPSWRRTCGHLKREFFEVAP